MTTPICRNEPATQAPSLRREGVITAERDDYGVTVKVGGSLFDLPDLVERLFNWLEIQNRPCVLIAGGGHFADGIRLLQAQSNLDKATAHWLAIDAMSQSAKWLAEQLARFDDGWRNIESEITKARMRLDQGQSFLFDAGANLREDASRTLPIGWQVTSDSIAAWSAVQLGINSLFLFKSVGGDEQFSLFEAAAFGWVDEYFPNAAKGLQVSFVNLRTNRFASKSQPC